MIIHVHQADVEHGTIIVSGEETLAMPEAFELVGAATFTGKCSCIGDELFLVKGTLTFTAKTLCARCIRPVRFIMNIPLEERFSREDVSGEDKEIYSFVGDDIDLSLALHEAALTALPLRVLCREDCKGLCPICGTDRNENECGCEPVQNNAFSVLKKLDLPKEV